MKVTGKGWLTSRQFWPLMTALPAARPVMLLANHRLPDGNQVLARIMSLEIRLEKRKCLNTSIFT